MSTFESRQNALRLFRSHSHKFLTTSALTAAGLVSMGITAANAQNVAADALPQGAEVTRGAATFDYSVPNTLTIDQQASLTSAEYKGGFNIGSNAAVLMLQESGDIFVHIDKSNNTSFLEGLFSGSGSNFVLNKNGVIVTGTARIDMNSFVASTAASLDLDRLERDGHAVFTDFGDGEIRIEEGARVTVAEAGLAAFVSPFVSNAGVINAKMGTVAIGAGETVTLDLYGDGLVELAVDGELEDALIENTGTISAEGGSVQISARAAKDAVDNVINVDGIVTASSASVQGGKIVLSGGNSGKVTVSGTVDASGEGAGSIDVTGENIEIADTAELTANGGTNGDGGDIKVIAADKAIFRGSASAKGGTESGKGGFVETSGHGYIDVAGGTVNTLAADGTAGIWLIDPTDITVVFDNPANPNPFTVAGATSIIGWTQIGAALLSTDVVIATASAGPSAGNITFDTPGFTASGTGVGASRQGSSLEFIADNNIIVNEDITLSNIGTTTLTAGGSVVFNQDFKTFDGTVGDATVSGNLVVSAGDDINVAAGSTVGVTGAGLGDVTLTALNGDGGQSAIEIFGSVATMGGKLTLNSTGYFVEVNDTGVVTTLDGDLEVNSDHGFDIDAGGVVDLGAGDAAINAPLVQLGDDIVTTGTITGTATSVFVENANAEIGDGVGVAASGATVNIAAGTHTTDSQIVIDKDLTVTGAGKTDTIVNAGFNTGTGGDSRGWWLVTAGNEFNLSDLTLDGNGQNVWQALRVRGSGSVDNVAFNDIQYNASGPHYAGTAIAAFGDGTFDVTNSMFTNIGRIGVQYFGTLGVSGSTYADNMYTGKGDGDWLDYGVEVGGGAADIQILRSTITGNTGVASTDGSNSAGVLVSTFFGPGSSATIENNFINGNTIGVAVGFNSADTSDVVVYNNDLSGNTWGVTSTAPSVDASFNWWGSADEATVAGNVSTDVDISPFFVSGTDVDAAAGFQGDFSELFVTAMGSQTSALIQEGVDAVDVAGKVNVGAGTFNEKLLVNKSLHLRGVNRQSTFIDTSGFTGYGLQVTADDVTLDRFTLQDDGTSTYGIKATGDDLDLRVLLVRGFGRSEVDLNGVDGATLTSVIADGQNTAGVGIALSNVNDVTMTNVRTRNNNWGGVGLYDTVNGATTNVTLDAASSAQLMEDNPIYIDAEYGFGVSGIELPGFDFAVRNPNHRPGGDAFTFFQRTEQDAFNWAVGLDAAGTTIGSSVEGVGADGDNHVIYTNEFFVGEDAFGTSMFINPAIEEADAGATINVRAGTYEGTVNVDKSLNLYGAQMGNDARSGRVGANESVILGDIVVASNVDGLTVDGFTIENQGDAASGEKASLYLGNNVANVNVLNNIFDGQNTTDGRSGIVTSSTGVENVLVQNNLFTDARYGIYVNRNANNVDIVSNKFDANRHGVVIQDGGADTHIRGNAFLNNTGSGVYVWSANGFVSTIGTLNNNRFRDNGQHIFYLDGNAPDLLVDGSTGNTFYSNGGFKTTDAMTEAELFALEDLVTHKMDDAGNGLVVFRDGALFVTQNTGGIQHAIDIADAGDTVNVDGTTYTEDLTIDKELKLTGHGTTLQSAGAESLITVTAANVNIDPFAFIGDGVTTLYGISVVGGDGFISDGNSFTGFVEAAIELASSKNVKIFGNTITGGKTGIHGDDVQNIQVFENEVNDTTIAGIHIENSDGTGYGGGGKDVDLWKNTVAVASGIGILIQNSAFATVGPHPTNPFASGFSGGNTVSGGEAGIVVEDSDNAYVAYSTVDSVSGSGITVDGGANVSVLTNKVGTSAVTDNVGGEGILIDGSTGAIVKGNEVTETGENGIKFVSSNDGFIQGNDVSNAGHNGIAAIDSDNVTINMTNIVDGTRAAGISLNGTTNSLIDGNEISNTGGSGVWIKDADGSTVSGNEIDGTWKRAGAGTGSGVHVLSTDNATVSGNTIDNTNRGGNGVYADGSDNLKVNDNFIGTVGGNVSGNGVAIEGAKTAEVNGNEIKNVAKNGIKFIKGIKDGAVDIIGNDIDATMSGIVFGSASPSVDGSTVYVISNTVVAGDDAVRFDDAIVDSTVELNGNTLTAGSEGVDVMGAVTDSRVTLGGNVADPGYAFAFQTINADDNGVVFRGDVTGSQIYMPRQQITALDGEAVLFKGIVDNSRVSIGHGEGDYGGVWLSNVNGFFTGSETGVLFEDDVQNSSVIEIVNTTVTGQGGEAVHFEGDVDGSSVLIAGSTLNGQDGDAVLFEGAVTNGAAVRIGNGTATPLPLYTAAFGPFPLSYGGNTITGSENGIVFNGVNGGSSVTITNNSKIEGQNNDGIVFNGASPSISGGSNVTITGNTQILADNDGIKVEDDISGSGTQLNIRDNKIVAGEDGIDIDNVRNRASVEIGGSSYSRDGNWIIAGDDGIEFDAGIDSTVLIQNNRIDAGDDGIDVADDDRGHTTSIDSRAVVSILDNRIGSEGSDTIGDDGIVIDENITGGATLTISGNSIGRSGAKVGDDGIDLDNITGGAIVNIVNNPNNYASDNGINVSGSINGATLNITGNNHGIHADDHGIYVGGAIYGGSTVNIHDNIISANEDDGSTGDGIHFAGNIYRANINIGDGSGSSLYSNPSNFIRGRDGIHFAGTLNNGTNVKIDGNRIGYGKRSYGRYPIFSDAVSDDGIQFAQDVQGNANVKITDNYIKSDDDGVSFLDDIQDDARVLIGGHRDGNTIDADDEGIQFEDDIKGHSLLEISYNDIDADDNGIQFDGETSNHIHSGHGEEILIKHNSIVGDEHGILFNGTASNWRHDIVIRDNSLIKGKDENGITHVGNIDDAELWILNNGEIDGEEDGIHIEGYFYNGAKITIEGNGWDGGVRGRDDDGIHVADNGRDYGSDVLIKNNHVHHTGDDGIYVRNVKGVKIIENDIHDTGLESRDGDGIYVKDSDYALIKKNDITGAGRDGINVYSSYRADILFNDIYAEGGNRYLGRGQQGANRDGIHVEYSDKVDIIGNDITSDLGYGRSAVDQLGAGRHGIYVYGSDFADVNHNNVLGDVKTFFGFPIASVDSVGGNGIFVERSHFADIKFNDVERTGENGIKLRKSAFGDIKFNTVDRAGDDGIDVEYGAFVDIIGNKVSKSGDDGIDVEDSKFADIKFNKVTDSRRDGIEVDDSKYADIKFNLVVGAGDDGIDVDDSKFADIEYNIISFTKGDGIQVRDSFGADIMRNLVVFAGDDGIDVEDSSYVDVNGNFIRFVKNNGIEVSGGKQADIIGNNIRFVGRDGINVRDVYSMYNRGFDVVINENTVRDADDDGIEVKYSGDTQIDFNTVTDVGDDGIRVYNPRGSFIMSYPDLIDDGPSTNITRVSAYPYYEFVPANVEITNNTVTNAGTDGIEVTAYDVQLLADTNTVIDSGENGILLNALGGYSRYEDRIGDNIQTVSLVSTGPYPPSMKGPKGPGVFNSVLIDNGVENSGTNGIHAKGYGHGDVVLEGNTLVDNPVGARFESGAIDLTSLTNPNVIIVNPDYELPPGYEFVTGLQFELAGTSTTVASANSLTIVDETLGATAFTGFITRDVGDAFYVRFEDGAILDEFGNVIEINGEQVNFDGFVPLDNQDALGNISPTALAAIEDRLYDADDSPLNGRGQIFIGTPTVSGLDNVQDFFREFSEFAPGFGGFSLTLLGMPPVTQPLGSLNSIGTFAGGEDLNNINPAAGGEGGEGFNDIEPAAGNASSCWSDVVNAPANGGVSFNFSGDPTENLNAAASCGS